MLRPLHFIFVTSIVACSSNAASLDGAGSPWIKLHIAPAVDEVHDHKIFCAMWGGGIKTLPLFFFNFIAFNPLNPTPITASTTKQMLKVMLKRH
jgi:hypothetical protein